MLWIKSLFAALLLLQSVALYRDPLSYSLIQTINLIFHEAGHMFLMFFGHTIHALGGALFEAGIPLLIALYFIAKQQYYSAAFGFWWLSTALLSISVYAGDALVQELPLLGGEAVSHDWFTILGNLGLFRYTDEISGGFMALCVCALLAAGYFFYRDIVTVSLIS